jgi:hypothetical protein
VQIAADTIAIVLFAGTYQAVQNPGIARLDSFAHYCAP